MARRTKQEAAVTREQLLDAAERVFRERGVTRASLAEVAAAAGVTRGAVYWHFKDKADLFGAMVERATLPLDAMLLRADADACVDPLATLRELAIGALTRLAEDPRTQAVFEVIFHKSELTEELASVAARHDEERCACLSQVERILAHAAAIGQLPPDLDTALATRAMHGYISGIMREWVLDKKGCDLARVAPALADMFISGLRSSPPRRAETVRPRIHPRSMPH